MHIEMRMVAKRFGRTDALKDVDLEVEGPAILAILGENGAGKSTLLRVLAGLCAPDRGVVIMDGERFTRERIDQRQRLHFTPDMPLLFPDMSVARNIATFSALYGKSIAGREESMGRWLGETGAAPLMKRMAGNLSRGQAWKAGLACVAAIGPELWLVDEPFASGMDAIGMEAFRKLARHLHERGGTVIYTTQMVEMAAGFADRVIVLRDGRLVLDQPAGHVRERLGADPSLAAAILTEEPKDS